MKFFTAFFATFVIGAALLSTPATEYTEESYAGLCVVEFNAQFNSQNSVPWIEELSDCNGRRVDIAASPDQQTEYKIVVVPTIIIFNEGAEVKRYQANIMMELEVQKETIQHDIDEIIMSDF
jgi:hypothetical protein